MANIKKCISELVGNTPLLEVSHFSKANGIGNTRILLKLEYLNPFGSHKDRVALAMIRDAEKNGLLKPGGVIVEATHGNMGIGLSALSTARGYEVILAMPEYRSVERRNLLRAYGAKLVLTESSKCIRGSVDMALDIVKEIPGAYMLNQFENPLAAKAHFDTTGPEIWDDTDGEVDIFVCSVGTGGTISGVGEFLKSKNENVKIVAVEPAASPVLSGGEPAYHGMEGMGAAFIPKTLNTEIIDEIVGVTAEEAFEMMRSLVKTEGLLVGQSSGAALAAAKKIARLAENKGKMIVAFMPDSGERYLSTGVFDNL